MPNGYQETLLDQCQIVSNLLAKNDDQQSRAGAGSNGCAWLCFALLCSALLCSAPLALLCSAVLALLALALY